MFIKVLKFFYIPFVTANSLKFKIKYELIIRYRAEFLSLSIILGSLANEMQTKL